MIIQVLWGVRVLKVDLPPQTTVYEACLRSMREMDLNPRQWRAAHLKEFIIPRDPDLNILDWDATIENHPHIELATNKAYVVSTSAPSVSFVSRIKRTIRDFIR